MKKIVLGLVVLVVTEVLICSCASTGNIYSGDTKYKTNSTSDQKSDNDISYLYLKPRVMFMVVRGENNEIEISYPVFEWGTDNGFISYQCKDYVHGGETLFEIGYYDIEGKRSGFIILNQQVLKSTSWTKGIRGDNEDGQVIEAEYASFTIEGLNYHWNWGNKFQYTIVMSPDGAIRYYDFTNVPDGESTKPSGIYKAYKR